MAVILLVNDYILISDLDIIWQAKPETVNKVCEIVRKQLALPSEKEVTGASKFSELGADSLDTVLSLLSITNQCVSLNVWVFPLIWLKGG